MMRHKACAWTEDRQVAASLLHSGQLVADDAFPQFVVADLKLTDPRHRAGVLDPGYLPAAPGLQCFWGGGVVAVDVDDHAMCSDYFSPLGFALFDRSKNSPNHGTRLADSWNCEPRPGCNHRPAAWIARSGAVPKTLA